MYAELFDEKHRIRTLIPSDVVKGKGYIKMKQSGEYEGNILCEVCDNQHIGDAYEDYAKRALYGGELAVGSEIQFEDLMDQSGYTCTVVKNINYLKFKLFLLSILWRAGISSRDFFKEVQLGPHEEILREMILNGDPGTADEYPISFLTYANDPSTPKDTISEPRRIRTKEGLNGYLFIITGMVYVFYVNAKMHKLPPRKQLWTISPDNTMTVLHFPKGTGWNFVLRHCEVEYGGQSVNRLYLQWRSSMD